MELKYSPLKTLDSQSFYVERKKAPYFGEDWHYHEEYELLLTIKGNGVRIIGDNISQFKAPELIFMGANLPHLFKNKETNSDVDYIVLKFREEFQDQLLFSLPELSNIKTFIENSKRGILFSKETVEIIQPLFIELVESTKSARIINFIKILSILANDKQAEYIASENAVENLLDKNEGRIQNVISYLKEEYTRDISLDDLADVAHMTKNAFCRYFKNKTGKTPFQVIREYRVDKACQMLVNEKNEKSIAQICYDTGFNSFSSFNRIFKSVKNLSASEYKSQYIQRRAS